MGALLGEFNRTSGLTRTGQFGEVWQGRWKDAMVAVKVMKENSMEESAFIEEAEMMAKLKHPNLVQLYGVTQTRPICIVTEYMDRGCLLDHIRSNPCLVKYPELLLTFAVQICDAMRYLEHENIIHRDLAARNCLVNSSNQVKVADFGLSRFVLEDEYTSSVGAKFPIKWSAVEVLQYTQFSTKSDVWAFGILMWELFSGGKTPYPGMSNNEVLEFVDKYDRRLERPHDCPHDVFQVMRGTWHKDKDKRPTFVTLYTTLRSIVDDYNMDCRVNEEQFQ